MDENKQISRNDLMALFTTELDLVVYMLTTKYHHAFGRMLIRHDDVAEAAGQAFGDHFTRCMMMSADDTPPDFVFEMINRNLDSFVKGFTEAVETNKDPELRLSKHHDTKRLIDQYLDNSYPEGTSEETKKEHGPSDIAAAAKLLRNQYWQRGVEHNPLDKLELVAAAFKQHRKLVTGAHFPILD